MRSTVYWAAGTEVRSDTIEVRNRREHNKHVDMYKNPLSGEPAELPPQMGLPRVKWLGSLLYQRK